MTEREKEVLEYVINFRSYFGYSPTVQEIANGLNTKSTDHIRIMLAHLKDLGFIDMKPKSPRTIVVKRFIA